MSTKKENIDSFIKKVVEQYDVQYDHSHWEELEARLDAEMPVTVQTNGAYAKITSIVVSVISGMILMLGILWVGGVFEQENSTHQNQPTNAVGPTASSPLIDHSEKSDPPSEDVLSYQDPKKGGGEIKKNNASTPEKLKPSADAYGTVYYQPEENNIRRSGLSISRKYVHFQPLPSYMDRSELISDQHSSNEVVPIISSQKEQFRWGIAVSFAPDFNGVGMGSSKQMSKQLGIQLSTTFRERLMLSTGVLYNKKKYTADGEAYHPPGGYWNQYTDGVVPESIFGQCAVLDIPLNLTYIWRPKHKLQFLTTLGVSNYFILSEDYQYEFSYGYPGYASGWTTDEMSRLMFGVGNVSIGVQYFIRPHIAIKAEPYLKLPFTTIGWGNVDLYSAGTLISLKYLLK